MPNICIWDCFAACDLLEEVGPPDQIKLKDDVLNKAKEKNLTMYLMCLVRQLKLGQRVEQMVVRTLKLIRVYICSSTFQDDTLT